MPFVGDKGSYQYPEINRARLLSGEKYLAEGQRHFSVLPPSGPEVRELDRINPWSKSDKIVLSSTNAYGLTSRSESLFPEAFRPVDTKFWQPLTVEENLDIHVRQAAANLKATFGDDPGMRVGATSADEAYAEASGRRNQAMRRRRKPRNWDEQKREEELRKKDPLTRRYSSAELFYTDSSMIVKSGPLDTPILVGGLPVLKDQDGGPAPLKLRRKRRQQRRGRAQPEQQQTQVAEVGLPEFNPNSVPKVQLIRSHTNNPYGLPSRSEMDYPEAYRDLSGVYWKNLSDGERHQIMTVQARAMEKVGYEKGTEKRFIEDIGPPDEFVYKAGHRARTDDIGDRRGIDMESFVVLLVVLIAAAALAWQGYVSMDGASIQLPAALTGGDGEGGEE